MSHQFPVDVMVTAVVTGAVDVVDVGAIAVVVAVVVLDVIAVVGVVEIDVVEVFVLVEFEQDTNTSDVTIRMVSAIQRTLFI
jgi:hypothetical protein